MSARVLGLCALLATLALAGPVAPASAAGGEGSWQFAPALAPPPAPGVQPAPDPVPLGTVGDIEFWAPNRGLLIEGGNPDGTPVPAGVYAYNGVSWHQLSTECGGAGGRIAWAGPEEFWTIADQRAGQTGSGVTATGNVSLCHFANGQIVGSYALPLDQPDSYRPMDAAACLSPSDCWFGGALGVYPNVGSFHLHWNGQNVTVVYDANQHDDHAVTSMTNYRGTLYEGVQLTDTDEYGGDTPAQTPVLHTINSNESFSDIFLAGQPQCSGLCLSLPQYGADNPEALSGLLMSGDGGLSADPPAQPELWALSSSTPSGLAGSATAEPIILHCGSDSTYGTSAATLDCDSGVWQQAPSDLFPPGQQLSAVASEPGSDAAWIALHSNDGKAHLARVTATEQPGAQTIQLGAEETLGLGGQQSEDGDRGNASVVSCPAVNDCWLATDQGWLYHYTTGAQLPEDTDPNFRGVITYRPPDEGIPQLIADVPPPEESLAALQPPSSPTASPAPTPPTTYTTEQLVTHMRTRLVHRETLELSFTLAAQAHVQLLADRHGHAVARTTRKTLKAGHRKLLLRLNPKHWPTKLDLRATPLHPLPRIPVTGGGSSGEGTTTVAPPISAETVST